MAESRRPKRSSKEVSYASLDGGDDGSDDDFANFTPPPPKKSKKKAARKPADKSKPIKRKAPAERRSAPGTIDEDFDKDLQLALAMSQAEACPQAPKEEEKSPDVELNLGPTDRKEEVIADIHLPDGMEGTAAEPTEVKDCAEETSKAEPKTKSRNSSNEGDGDGISFIETVDPEFALKPSGRGQRRAAKTATSRQKAILGSDDEGGDEDSGDEYKADDLDLDESDEGGDDEGADEDFSLSPVKKKRRGSGGGAAKKGAGEEAVKKKPAAKREAKKRGNENTAPKPAAVKRTPLVKKSQSRSFTPPSVTRNSATKSPNLPAVRQIKRSPLVCSPKDSNGNNPLGGVRLVSPGQPFRLGLSRFARVKPLHAAGANVT